MRMLKRTPFVLIVILLSLVFARAITAESLANYESFLPLVERDFGFHGGLGLLDPDFGDNGKILTHIYGDDTAQGLAIQPDGKIVVAGTSIKYDFSYMSVARYNADGSLDTTFASLGYDRPVFGAQALGNDVALQPDGKIVVAGSTDFFNGDFALVRYTPEGELDTSFDGDGLVTTDFSNHVDVAHSVLVGLDGKILVAGTARDTISQKYNTVLARYNPDGNLDVSFDGDGRVVTDFSGSDDLVEQVIFQPDGRLIVAGYIWNGANWDILVARYNVDGSLDLTFDNDGWVATDFAGSDDYGYGVAQQENGKIVVAGYADIGDNYDMAVVRYNHDGSLDTSFGSGGKVTVNWGCGDQARAVTIQPDGKIIAAGYLLCSDEKYYFAMARLNYYGSLDAEFGDSGKLFTDVGAQDFAYDIALQADSKIVITGSTTSTLNEATADFALLRYR